MKTRTSLSVAPRPRPQAHAAPTPTAARGTTRLKASQYRGSGGGWWRCRVYCLCDMRQWLLPGPPPRRHPWGWRLVSCILSNVKLCVGVGGVDGGGAGGPGVWCGRPHRRQAQGYGILNT
ncbi:hypothetical protein E2C01_038926 [Portunus trituberculatus]|uniref:Uncharacterized protein n=1 Tax=Portunus trituberculatus TaxID=210409 RepID=A0A5B7FJB6_PORTR|nr:hypothetical protein [Portunus trituberculatus]